MNMHKTKCLIIAAGEGSRLQSESDLKPLTPVSGIPLIQRIISNAMLAGIEEFFIATGYMHETLDAFLYALGTSLDVKITTIFNPDWVHGNATSVFAAENHIKGNFVLLMADHLVEPELIKKVIHNTTQKHPLCLAIDHDLNNKYVDNDDATKVLAHNGYIEDIGKQLTQYNAYDTGVFHCDDRIFSTLSETIALKQYGLSDCVKKLASTKLATTVSGNGAIWIDIDSPEMLQIAEQYINE